MLYQITKNDEVLLKDFYRQIQGSLEEVQDIVDNVMDSLIVMSIKENGHIIMLLIVKLIHNNYYLGDIKFLVKDWDLMRQMIKETIETLRRDERGLNIFYDNSPYSVQMNSLLIECGFKGISSLYHYHFKEDTIWPLKHNFIINDRQEDVNWYLLEHHRHSLDTANNYLGFKLDDQPEVVNLDNANIVVIRSPKAIRGVVKFNLIGSTIVLSLIYGESKDIIVDLINYIRNLTNRDIVVKVLYVRQYIRKIFEDLGFKNEQTELIYKLY